MTSSESTNSKPQRCVAAHSSASSSGSTSGQQCNGNGGAQNGHGRNSIRRRSYADWITRAIQSSPDSKMTLASIYNWMASNVPGLYEKRNLHSSKGWKNAVRHTLSVNRRFQKSSQPNARAALWSLAPSPDNSPVHKPQESEQISVISPGILELPSCSTFFPNGIPVTTGAAAACLRSSPATSTYFSSTATNSDSLSEPVVTQTLEVHHQDGTVRTVTVPKPYPIHIVGDYRVVTVDAKLHLPKVVTSG